MVLASRPSPKCLQVGSGQWEVGLQGYQQRHVSLSNTTRRPVYIYLKVMHSPLFLLVSHQTCQRISQQLQVQTADIPGPPAQNAASKIVRFNGHVSSQNTSNASDLISRCHNS